MPRLNVEISDEMAAFVRSKVEKGTYASEREVVETSLRLLGSEEDDIERWLREEVVPAYEDFVRDPSGGLTADEVRASLAARRRERDARRS